MYSVIIAVDYEKVWEEADCAAVMKKSLDEINRSSKLKHEAGSIWKWNEFDQGHHFKTNVFIDWERRESVHMQHLL